MATKRLKRPRGAIRLGKLIVDIVTSPVEDALAAAEEIGAGEARRGGGEAYAAVLASL